MFKDSSDIPEKMIAFALNRPKLIVWSLVVTILLLIAFATLPTVWPQHFPALYALKVDTDPENMLSESESVRVFHNKAKKEFALHDVVVVGIVNEKHSNGVFNVDSLARIYQLTQFARQLDGVIEVDLIAPSTVDNIEQGGLGTVNFSWLMPQPPADDEEALKVRDRAMRIPFLHDTLVSADGKAIALYLPLVSKDHSYRIREALLKYTANWQNTNDQVHITGLPVAEDTFGVEMFIQMAISAPLAMLVIFALLWWFFRHLIVISSPMILAVACALATMSLLIISGNTVHIMSSMIPIFIMPIAVLDSVHILSEFFDRYPQIKDRRKTIEQVMRHLFQAMLFTSLTTMAGFASLALTPIPPVQVFGIFIAIGVFLAWIWTMLFIPAYIMLIPEHKLSQFGHVPKNAVSTDAAANHVTTDFLQKIGRFTYQNARGILVASGVFSAIAIWGISLIQVNDNPVKWFVDSHPIRVADRVLNQHFGGTYMAYLEFESDAASVSSKELAVDLSTRLVLRKATATENNLANAEAIFDKVIALAETESLQAESAETLLTKLATFVETSIKSAPRDMYDTWSDVQSFLDEEQQRSEIFKQPQALHYLASLQNHLSKSSIVGKSSSVVDVVKTVHRELLLGEDAAFRIPNSANAVGQTLITYQNSHRPHDLWHFVTPDYRKAVVWLQLTSGDNRDMEAVIASVDAFIAQNPPPYHLNAQWFGLTYINTVWQEKMVFGMLESFLGSFVMVLIMMIALFRSLLWGLLSMIPLTVTVGVIYGIVGLTGKSYDMPVAVLSALSLGLAVDYAIHLISHARELRGKHDSWEATIPAMFGEPARAISRNAIILGAGFLPLLAAPLIPYQTVGVFIAAIIGLAGVASLLILPALIRVLEKYLFPQTNRIKHKTV